MIRMLLVDWFTVKGVGFSSEATEGADQNLLRPERVLEHLCVPATVNNNCPKVSNLWKDTVFHDVRRVVLQNFLELTEDYSAPVFT